MTRTRATRATRDDEDDHDQNEDDKDDKDDSNEGSANVSRSVTPDMSKPTRQQRDYLEEPAAETSLMAPSDEAQTKKQLTSLA